MPLSKSPYVKSLVPNLALSESWQACNKLDVVGLQVTGTMILKETLGFQSQTFLLFLFPGL